MGETKGSTSSTVLEQPAKVYNPCGSPMLSESSMQTEHTIASPCSDAADSIHLVSPTSAEIVPNASDGAVALNDTANSIHALTQVDVTDPDPTRSKIRTVAVLAALYSTLFVSALDATVVATAIPTISSQLHSASGYAWISGAYQLASAASGPVWAKLSDIWGRKPILLSATAVFAAGSIVSALAKSMTMLIAGRAVQGVAAGGLIEMVHITISDLFSLRQRSLYIGMLECVWAIAGGVGPTLGGILTQFVSWRWIFWINLPISGTTFVLLLIFLDVHNPRTRISDGLRAIDWFGSISILGVTLMLLLGLDFGGVTFPWTSPKVICLIIFGALMSIIFIYSEKRLARYPLMPFAMFKHRSNIASLLVGLFHSFVFIAGEFYLPLFFQSVRQATPLRSGLLVIPLTVSEAISGLSCGIFIHRSGRYLELIWVGSFLMILGNGLYIMLGTGSSLGEIIALQLVAGLGAGMIFEAPLIALHTLVSQADTATATATFGFIRNLGIAMSIILGGVVFQNGMQTQQQYLMDAGLSKNITESFAGSNAAANVLLIPKIQDPAQNLAVRGAFASSLRNLWIMYTCVAACCAVASAFISKQALSREHVETKTGLKNMTS